MSAYHKRHKQTPKAAAPQGGRAPAGRPEALPAADTTHSRRLSLTPLAPLVIPIGVVLGLRLALGDGRDGAWVWAELSAYVAPSAGLGWTLALIALYCAIFAAVAVVIFERKDF